MASDAEARDARTWRTGRAAAGAVGLAFALLYLFEGRNLPLGRMGSPGPGIFPLIVGAIFALVSVSVIVDALKTSQPGAASFPIGQNRRRLLIVAATFIAYVLLLDVIGFFAASIGLVIVFTRLVGGISWLAAAASGVAVTLGVWAVFTVILGVRLPTGIWG